MDLDGVHSYERASSRRQLHDTSGATRLVAGGTALFSAPLTGPSRLVGLSAMGWPAVDLRDDGLVIAATCSIRELEHRVASWGDFGRVVRCCADALAAGPGVQSRATVGGNICGASPAAAMVALGAATEMTALIWRPDGGERRLPVTDLVAGSGVTTLRPGEVLRSLTVSVAALGATYAVRRVSKTPDARTAALVIGTRWPDPSVRRTVSVTGAVAVPRVLEFDSYTNPLLAHDLVAGWPAQVWLDDTDGSARWRRGVTLTFVRDVLTGMADSGGA
jgi:CO/xanthine dehydrogenase FAD-binding subunit